MAINELFTQGQQQEATTNSRSLSGTAQLTKQATDIAHAILKTIDGRFDEYKELVAKSKVDHNVMDELIAATYNLTAEDIDFLKELDDTTKDNMLKSQQSKRSRAKSKTMTMENYTNMMIGAIAENLVRLSMGKSKSSVGAHRAAGSVEYTPEALQELIADQEKLRKEIRNVQSKKSIMKSKADFSETDERWLSLLKAEEQLKAMRSGTTAPTVVRVDVTREKLQEILGDVDPFHIRNAEARELLARCKALLEQPEPASETENDDQQNATDNTEHTEQSDNAAGTEDNA